MLALTIVLNLFKRVRPPALCNVGLAVLAAVSYAHAFSLPVLRLPSGPLPAQVAAANRALEDGSVVVMKNADPKRFSAMFNVALADIQDPVGNGPIRHCLIAVRRSANGNLRSFVGPRVVAGPNDLQLCEYYFQRWVARQSLTEAADAGASPWTEVSSSPLPVQQDPHGTLEVSPIVYRASTTDSYYDYFMVVVSNKSTVTNGALLSRTTTITTDLTGAGVFQDAPQSGTLGNNNQFTLGSSLMVQPLMQPAYTQSWSQAPAVLKRNSSANWTESWLSPVSSGTSETYEGVIFQVPKGTTSFALQISTQSSFTTGKVPLNGSLHISAPALSVPSDFYVLQGQQFNLNITASKYLNWQFTSSPQDWNSVDSSTYSGTKNIRVTVPPDAENNTVYEFVIDSQPAFASPSVAGGGLQVRVHVVPQLPQGGILFTGGYGPNGSTSATAQIFNPGTNQITATNNSMSDARQWHTATLLGNGKILLAGGFGANGVALSSTDLFDPATGTFTRGPSMSHNHAWHTATLLNDGKVLIAGGFDEHNKASAFAEVYVPPNPGTSGVGLFEPALSMTRARGNFAASLLGDSSGSVLMTGGTSSTSDPNSFSDAEIYNPANNEFLPLKAMMNMDRRAHVAVTLQNGQVLLIGGDTGQTGLDPIRSMEIFNPESQSFANVAPLSVGRRFVAAALQPDGQVFFAGGDNAASAAEYYDPQSQSWYDTSNFMRQNRSVPTAVFIHDTDSNANGLMVVAGGTSATDVETFNRDTQGWTTVAQMNLGRTAMTATLFGLTVSPTPAQPSGVGSTKQ